LGLDHNGNELFSSTYLSLQRGTIYGLIGKNGTGKSSLAKILASKALPFFPTSLSTQYLSPGDATSSTELSSVKVTARAYMLQSAKQKQNDIEERIQLLENQFEEMIDQHRDDNEVEAISTRIGELYDLKDEIIHSSAQKVEHMLDELGFKSSNMMDTTVEHLSCGWRYKCYLATTFLTQPDLLVIDEPCFLDAKSTSWFIHQMKVIAKESNSIVLLISHKVNVLDALCESILFINPASKTLSVYACNYKNFMVAHGEKVKYSERAIANSAKENYIATKSLHKFQKLSEKKNLSRIKMITVSKNKTHDCKKTGRAAFGGAKMDKSIAAKEQRLQKKAKDIDEATKAYKQQKNVRLVLEGASLEGLSAEMPIISLQDVHFAYTSTSSNILCGVSAQIRAKDKVLLQGGNGQGKSTLVKLLLEGLRPESGSIYKHARSHVMYFPQNALENLMKEQGSKSSLDFLQSFDTNNNETAIRTHLGKFGIKQDLATRPIRTLSAGQQVRLYLAKEMFVNGTPSLLVMDEVTENLDKESVDSFVETLNQFPGGVLCISHDEYFIEQFNSSALTQTWTLENGKLKVEFN